MRNSSSATTVSSGEGPADVPPVVVTLLMGFVCGVVLSSFCVLVLCSLHAWTMVIQAARAKRFSICFAKLAIIYFLVEGFRQKTWASYNDGCFVMNRLRLKLYLFFPKEKRLKNTYKSMNTGW